MDIKDAPSYFDDVYQALEEADYCAQSEGRSQAIVLSGKGFSVMPMVNVRLDRDRVAEKVNYIEGY